MATRELHSPPPSVTSPAFSDPIEIVETPPSPPVETPPIEMATPTRQLRTQHSHPRAEKKRRVEGVWIMPTTSKTGQGACRKDTQRWVGKMLGLFTTLSVPTTKVL